MGVTGQQDLQTAPGCQQEEPWSHPAARTLPALSLSFSGHLTPDRRAAPPGRVQQNRQLQPRFLAKGMEMGDPGNWKSLGRPQRWADLSSDSKFLPRAWLAWGLHRVGLIPNRDRVERISADGET